MDNNTLAKKLYHLSCYRGSKEMDLILGKFAKARLFSLTPLELKLYDDILKIDDQTLWSSLSLGQTPENLKANRVYQQLLDFTATGS